MDLFKQMSEDLKIAKELMVDANTIDDILKQSTNVLMEKSLSNKPKVSPEDGTKPYQFSNDTKTHLAKILEAYIEYHKAQGEQTECRVSPTRFMEYIERKQWSTALLQMDVKKFISSTNANEQIVSALETLDLDESDDN